MENLKTGMMIKNYKELCGVMGWKITTGKSKKLQMEELKRLCRFHKSGNSFIIDEVYETIIEKVDLRTNGNNSDNFKEYQQFNVKKEHWFDIGVYKIIDLNNNCYIGSTIRSFRERFVEHHRGLQDNTKELMNNGGIFEIVKIMNNFNEEEIRKKENEYLQIYKLKYNVANKQDYVGGFTPKKKKKILVDEENYEKAIKLLEDNDLV